MLVAVMAFLVSTVVLLGSIWFTDLVVRWWLGLPLAGPATWRCGS